MKAALLRQMRGWVLVNVRRAWKKFSDARGDQVSEASIIITRPTLRLLGCKKQHHCTISQVSLSLSRLGDAVTAKATLATQAHMCKTQNPTQHRGANRPATISDVAHGESRSGNFRRQYKTLRLRRRPVTMVLIIIAIITEDKVL
jgi:hypothetical protein